MEIRGRLLALAHGQALVWTSQGKKTIDISDVGPAQVGDWVLVVPSKTPGQPSSLRVLTPNRHPERRMRFFDRIQDPRRQRGVAMRTQVESLVRKFFNTQDFLETRTPLLVACPGMETHIRPFELKTGAYLPTSPEFALKRLLVGGLEKIFQITPTFRLEPKSSTHHPEFTMLEWYRAFAGMEEIMSDTEKLLETLAQEIHGKPEINFQGRRFSVRTPWPRLSIRELFRDHAGVDLVACNTPAQLSAECKRLGLTPETPEATSETWDDLYFRIWLNVIEPKLPQDQAVFVYGYPPSQAALSVIETHSDGSRWARRFEAYLGGIELCNAFEELTDPAEQRARFIKDMELRAQIYGKEFPKTSLDEDFLEALAEGLPPSGGNALGIDRLVMLLGDEPDIRYTFWLEAYAEPGDVGDSTRPL
ncbi:EF-P lysine aminoacylase GenX [bacterium]|nr:EF-P lysine aminoacylase GenX [bacterium]